MTNKLEKHDFSRQELTDIKAKQDALKTELNKAPGTTKVNKYAGNSQYVPIGIVQSYLDSLFLSWDWKINDAQVVMNGYMVRGTLKCYTATGGVIEVDGIGASEFQLQKGEKILSPDTLNSKAIERDVPKAEAEAFKSAAKKLGRKFGRSLNREDDHEYVKFDIMSKLFNDKKD